VRRLFLLSNSRNFGAEYLEHALEAIVDFLGPVRRLTFVPFALHDHIGYAERVGTALRAAGITLDRLTPDPAGRQTLACAEAVYVGGGNTFRLLRGLRHSGLLADLRQRALAGTPYLGASAGTNIAAPTIRTTNDMPIVEPDGFDALGLVPFQINPHYLDPAPGSRHMGETRETRIQEFHEENPQPVLGLREGTWLRVEGNHGTLEGGEAGARVFRRDAEPEELRPGARLDGLLSGSRLTSC
jgi:dipeptidase E